MVNAFATLLFTNSYLPGALILGKTLKQLNKFDNETRLIVLSAARLTPFEEKLLDEVYDEVHDVSLIHARKSEELQLLGRPELSPTFSKINLFKLTQFDKILFLDADTLPVKPLEELFTIYADLLATQIAASPDSGWPDIFNSGFFLIKPSIETYLKLLDKIQLTSNPSFDGADQGLLNQFFHLDDDAIAEHRQWLRLPFLYNVTPSGQYQYQPAFNFFNDKIRLVHFIGPNKPWADVHDKGGLREKWWLKYHEFFGGGDDDIQKIIHGIDSLYYEAEYEENKEREQKGAQQVEEYRGYHEETQPESRGPNDNEVLLNPESFKYFETIPTNENRWDPAHEEPPKDGRPEAASFPQLHDYSSEWANDQSQEEYYYEPEAPPPIFPWESYKNDKPQVERIFANEYAYGFEEAWGALPTVKKIKDKQEQELVAQEAAHKRAEDLARENEEEQRRLADQKERLKVIESRYSGDIKVEPFESTALQPEPLHLEEPENVVNGDKEKKLVQSLKEVLLEEKIDESEDKLES